MKDIADQLEVESPLFGEDESKQGVVYNKGFPDDDEKEYQDTMRDANGNRMGIPAYIDE